MSTFAKKVLEKLHTELDIYFHTSWFMVREKRVPICVIELMVHSSPLCKKKIIINNAIDLNSIKKPAQRKIECKRVKIRVRAVTDISFRVLCVRSIS